MRRVQIGGLLLLALLICLFIGLSSREPLDQGRRLRGWLGDLRHPSPLVRHRAQEAIGHIGTNAVPWLRKILHAEDSPGKTNLIHLLSQQPFVRIRFVPARERRISAALACALLGPKAAPTIPDLFEFSNEDVFCRNLVESALGKMGAGTVEPLSLALTNEDFNVRRIAVGALAQIGARANSATDALLNCLNDRYGSVRSEAAYALGRMQPSPAIVKGLAATLDDTEPDVRRVAAVSLIGFGESSIPILNERLKISDQQAATLITNVLKGIEAAEKNSSKKSDGVVLPGRFLYQQSGPGNRENCM